MESLQRIPQVLSVEVSIDLCSGNAFMPQHLLDGSQVGAAFYQVGGKRMTKSMWRDILADTGLLHQILQKEKDHYTGKPGAPPVQEQDIFLPRLDRHVY